MNIIPIILCGGKGTRLWPLSRESYPKQFLSLYGENNKSLLQQTQLRILGIEKIDDPIIICNEEHRFLVAEQMRNIGIHMYLYIYIYMGIYIYTNIYIYIYIDTHV